MSTGFGLLVAITLLLVLEGWALLNKKPNDTISETVWRISFKYPFVPFLVGFLMGHLFWPSVAVMDWLK